MLSVANPTGLGVADMKAAFLILSEDGTNSVDMDHARFGFGFTDGTDSSGFCYVDEDNQATSDNSRRHSETYMAIMFSTNGTVIAEGSFNAWETDGNGIVTGIEIAWNTQPTEDLKYTVAVLGGNAMQAKVYAFTGNNTDNGTVDINVGFDPDVLVHGRTGRNNPDTSPNTWDSPLSLVTRTGASGVFQRSFHGKCDHNEATSKTGRRTNASLGRNYSLPGGGLALIENWWLVSAWIANGFRVQSQSALGGGSVLLTRHTGIAMAFDNVAATVANPTSPTVTGVVSYGQLGAPAGFVLGMTVESPAGSGVNNDDMGQCIGMGDFLALGEGCAAVESLDGLATTDSKSRHSEVLFETILTGITARLDSPISTGFDLNWTSVDTTARRFGFLAIEETPFVLEPGSVLSAEAVGTPTVVPGVVIVSPGGVASAEAVGVPAVVPGVVTVLPGGVASAEAVGTPALASTITILPGGVASAEAVGAPVLDLGAITVVVSGVPSAEAAGTPTLVPGATTVIVGGVPSAEAVGTPLVAPGAAPTIIVGGVASAEAVGGPAVLAGTITILPGSVPSAEAVGVPELIGAQTILVGGVPSAEAVGLPELVAERFIVVAGVPSAEAVGTHALETGENLVVTGVPSAEAVGTPVLTIFGVTLEVVGVPSAEAVGDLTVNPGGVTVVAGNVASAEAVGVPIVSPGVVTILPTGVASAEAVGVPIVDLVTQFVLPGGVASAEAVGVPMLVGDEITLANIGGVPSAEAVGIPFIRGGKLPVTYKKAIYDALIARAKAGTFIEALYDSETCELVQGLQVAPASVEANEVSSAYRIAPRQGRRREQERAQWQWLMILRFHQEVITDVFETSLGDDIIRIPRDPANGRPVDAHVELLQAAYEHPPREGSSNGTEARLTFSATLCPK